MFTEIEKNIYAAALMEGEGSFIVGKSGTQTNKVRVSIQMTDKDVLERMQNFFGGWLGNGAKPKKEHWKSVWMWLLHGESAYLFTQKVLPYMGSRRTSEALKLINTFEEMQRYQIEKEQKVIELRQNAFSLKEKAPTLTHAEIAKILGVGRSYISHILRGRYS